MECGVQNSDLNEAFCQFWFPPCYDDGVFISSQVLFPWTFSALSLLRPQIFNFIPFISSQQPADAQHFPCHE